MTKNHPYPSTDHYRYQFPLCMSPTPQLTPKMGKVEKNLCITGQEQCIVKTPAFWAVYLTLPVQHSGL